MVIDSTLASAGGVSALLRGVGGNSGTGVAGLSYGSTASAFGPASLLSLVGATSSGPDGMAGLYSNLATAISSRGPQTAAPRSERQVEAEKKGLKTAAALSQAGQFDAARDTLKELLAQDPSRGTVVRAQGLVELAAGKYDKAEAFFRKAAFLDPSLNAELDADNARVLQKNDKTVLARAQRLIAQADTSAAGLSLLETLAARSPGNYDVRVTLAEEQMKAGSPLKGLFSYARAVAIANPSQLDSLEKKFEQFVAADPNDAFARNLLGRTQLKLGRSDEALETLTLATELSGFQPSYQADEALAHVAVGRDRLTRGDVSAALNSFERAYELDPTSTNVKLARAEAFTQRAEDRLRVGDTQRAIQDFEKAARDAKVGSSDELRERIARGAFNVGRTLERRRIASGEDVGSEVIAFQAAYDIDPENATYRRKLAETRKLIGDQYLADEDYAAAAGSYRRAYELEKNNAEYKASAINAYRLDGDEKRHNLDYTGAINAYRLAFDLDTHDETSRFKLADTYNAYGLHLRDIGNRADAAGNFREALHLYPDNAEYQANYDSVYP